MRTLLVALDGSPRAGQVLAIAVEQAKGTGAKLVLVRAIGVPVDLPFAAMGMSPAEVLSVLEQRARAELTDLARVVPDDVPCETLVETGTAWQVICHAAREVDAALLIIGSHGYGGFDRVLGTTAGRVVNHADRSVLVVRAAKSAD